MLRRELLYHIALRNRVTTNLFRRLENLLGRIVDLHLSGYEVSAVTGNAISDESSMLPQMFMELRADHAHLARDADRETRKRQPWR